MNGDIHRPMRSGTGFQQRRNYTSRSVAPDSRAMASGALPANSQHAQNIPPPTTATPISRTDTTSAESTLYAVRYHPIEGPSPPIPEETQAQEPKDLSETSDPPSTGKPQDESKEEESSSNLVRAPLPQIPPHGEIFKWIAANNPFKRRRASPPPEVAIAQAVDRGPPRPSQKKEVDRNERWNVKSKLENFAVSQREKMKSRSEGRITETSLPVTVIPAQPRGQRTWSPQYYEDQMSQQGNSEQTAGSSDRQEQNQTPDYDPHHTQAAPVNPHYVPLPPQPRPGYGDRYSPNSSIGRLLSRKGTLTFNEEEGRMVTSPPSSASPIYRHSQYSLPTHTELTPIYSIPSSEQSIQPPEDPEDHAPNPYDSSRNVQSSSHARPHTTQTTRFAVPAASPRQSSNDVTPHPQGASAQTSGSDPQTGGPSAPASAHPPGETRSPEDHRETGNPPSSTNASPAGTVTSTSRGQTEYPQSQTDSSAQAGETLPSNSNPDAESTSPTKVPTTESETQRPDGPSAPPHAGETPTLESHLEPERANFADAPDSAVGNGSENSQQDQDERAAPSNPPQPVMDTGNDNAGRAVDV